MARIASNIQMNLPSYEADGATHARECECARCEAGFRPSEGQRREAASIWREHEQRAEAHVALERMKRRQRERALKLDLALTEQVRATDALLEEQEQQREKAGEDAQVQELLRLRAQGVSIAEAMRQVDRFPAKRARRS